jgi:hypothetical protein
MHSMDTRLVQSDARRGTVGGFTWLLEDGIDERRSGAPRVGLVGPGLARLAKCECRGLCSIWALGLESTIDRHSGDLVFHIYGASVHKSTHMSEGSRRLSSRKHGMAIVYAYRKYEPAEAVAPSGGPTQSGPVSLARPHHHPAKIHRSGRHIYAMTVTHTLFVCTPQGREPSWW